MLTFLFSLISGSQLLSELASYVEMKLGQDELLSSEKACSKVKLEIQRANCHQVCDPFPI